MTIDSCGNEVFSGDVVVTHQRGYHHFCYAIVTKATPKRVNIVLAGKLIDEAEKFLDKGLQSSFFVDNVKSFRSPLNVAKVCDVSKLSANAIADLEKAKKFISKHLVVYKQ